MVFTRGCVGGLENGWHPHPQGGLTHEHHFQRVIRGIQSVHIDMAIAGMHRLLALLEAEPVAWRSLYYENHGLLTGSKNVLASWQKQGWLCEPLFTVPPAPVVDQDLLHMAAAAVEDLLSHKDRSGSGVWADISFKLRRAAQNERQNA